MNIRWLISVFVIVGCSPIALYPGPRLPRMQTAIISTVEWAAVVTAIDGQPVKDTTGLFEVLPGPHTITVTDSFSHVGEVLYRGEATVTFTAEAGHRYEVHSGMDEYGKVSGSVQERP